MFSNSWMLYLRDSYGVAYFLYQRPKYLEYQVLNLFINVHTILNTSSACFSFLLIFSSLCPSLSPSGTKRILHCNFNCRFIDPRSIRYHRSLPPMSFLFSCKIFSLVIHLSESRMSVPPRVSQTPTPPHPPRTHTSYHDPRLPYFTLSLNIRHNF